PSEGPHQERTSGFDKVNWARSIFSARLAGDREGVTGGGESYTIWFGNNKGFDAHAEMSVGENGRFVSKTGGFYDFSATAYLSGVSPEGVVEISLVTPSRTYYLYRGQGYSSPIQGGSCRA